jgi:hypothetical protein
VTVKFESADALGNVSWLPVYRASLPIELAAQVKWDTASPDGLKTVWTVVYCAPDLVRYQ